MGHLFVAVLQGILGGIGFWVAALPDVIFWAYVMALLSLLPLIGPIVLGILASAMQVFDEEWDRIGSTG